MRPKECEADKLWLTEVPEEPIDHRADEADGVIAVLVISSIISCIVVGLFTYYQQKKSKKKLESIVNSEVQKYFQVSQNESSNRGQVR